MAKTFPIILIIVILIASCNKDRLNENEIIKKAKNRPAKTEFKLDQLIGRFVYKPGIEIKTSIMNDSLHVLVTIDRKNKEFNIGRINGDTFETPHKNVITFSDSKNGFSQKLRYIDENDDIVFRRKIELDITQTSQDIDALQTEPSSFIESYPNDSITSFYIMNVPENRNNPDTRFIEIAVSVLRAKNKNSNKFPILFIDGGPGDKTLMHLYRWTNSDLRNDHDIILFDIRGVGYSKPNICPDIGKEFIKTIALNINTYEEFVQNVNQIVEKSKDSIKRDPIDISAYNSLEVANDVSDIMELLQYDYYHLYGISYGTRVAQLTALKFPDKVKSIVLESPVTIDGRDGVECTETFMNSLTNIIDDLNSDQLVSKEFPDLLNMFYKSIDDFNVNPLKLSLYNAHSYKYETFYLNSSDILLVIHQFLYSSYLQRYIPLLVNAISDRDRNVMTTIFEEALKSSNNRNMLLLFYISMNDNTAHYTLEDFIKNEDKFPLLNTGLYTFKAPYSINIDWNIKDRLISENNYLESEIPTLILTGTYDPAVSPMNYKRISKIFTNSRTCQYQTSGHGIADISKPILTFLEDYDKKRNNPIKLVKRKIEFVSGVYQNSFIAKYANDLFIKRKIMPVSVLVSISILVLLSFVLLPIRLVKGKNTNSCIKLNNKILIYNNFLIILFLATLFITIKQTSENNIILLVFGLPEKAKYIFILPYLIIPGILLFFYHLGRNYKQIQLGNMLIFEIYSAIVYCIFVAQIVNYRLFLI